MVAFLYIVYTLVACMAVLLVIACILVAAFMLLRWITVALYRKYRESRPSNHSHIISYSPMVENAISRDSSTNKFS